jgi:SPP1 gp7 family putative phage head morphogenesis protein
MTVARRTPTYFGRPAGSAVRGVPLPDWYVEKARRMPAVALATRDAVAEERVAPLAAAVQRIWRRQADELDPALYASFVRDGVPAALADRYLMTTVGTLIDDVATTWDRAQVAAAVALGVPTPDGPNGAWQRQRVAEIARPMADTTYRGMRDAADILRQAKVDPVDGGRLLKSMVGLTAPDASSAARRYVEAAGRIGTREALQAAALDARQLLNARADAIAQTEVTAAYSGGLQAATTTARETGAGGLPDRIWRTAHDERTCPICRPLDGELADAGGSFPGGLQPPAHVGCRCAIDVRLNGPRPVQKRLRTFRLVAKANPYHDSLGQFTSAGHGGGVAMLDRPLSPPVGRSYAVVWEGQKPGRPSARSAAENLLGKHVTDEQVGRLAGAPDGSTVYVKREDGLKLTATHPDIGWMERTVRRQTDWTSEGARRETGVEVVNELYRKAPGAPEGSGARMLARQVEAARELGVTLITTHAIRSSSSITDEGRKMNGYYTWARLGYDGSIPATPIAPPAGMGHTTRISELMATKEGRSWWKEHGQSVDLEFDPAPGSLSSRVLESYVKEKGYDVAKAAAAVAGSVDCDDLTDADEVLLDRIWAREAAAVAKANPYHDTLGQFASAGVGGLPALTADAASPSAWRGAVEAARAPHEASRAGRLGLSTEEYRRRLDGAVSSLVRDAPVHIRVEPAVLGSVLRDGRFKTQVETGTTAKVAMFDPADRKRFESAVLAVSPDAPLMTRPVYGYLGGDGRTRVKHLDGYGTAVVRLKPAVRGRTSITEWDSLDGTSGGERPTLAAVPLTSPNRLMTRTFPDSGSQYAKSEPDWLEGRYRSVDHVLERGRFIETQTRGVTAADIERVAFKSTPAPELAAALEAGGIPWSVGGLT